jgi:hypothetical protein
MQGGKLWTQWQGNPQFLSGNFKKKNVCYKLKDVPTSISLALLSLL